VVDTGKWIEESALADCAGVVDCVGKGYNICQRSDYVSARPKDSVYSISFDVNLREEAEEHLRSDAFGNVRLWAVKKVRIAILETTI
jgi:hypothetical protein